MGKRDNRILLTDILDSIEKIEQYSIDIEEHEFRENSEKQDAVIRRIEIIGEAVKHLSTDLTDKYSHIPWRQIAGMRDILIHNYFGVSTGLVWRVVKQEIPTLKQQLREVLRDLDS